MNDANDGCARISAGEVACSEWRTRGTGYFLPVGTCAKSCAGFAVTGRCALAHVCGLTVSCRLFPASNFPISSCLLSICPHPLPNCSILLPLAPICRPRASESRQHLLACTGRVCLALGLAGSGWAWWVLVLVVVVAEVCVREVHRPLWLMWEVQRLLPDVKVLVLVRCERECECEMEHCKMNTCQGRNFQKWRKLRIQVRRKAIKPNEATSLVECVHK